MAIMLPDISDCYTVVSEQSPADICFYSVQLEDESLLRPTELNVFVSVENLEYWGSRRKHYKFYNKFGRVGSLRTNVYIQNDCSAIVKADKYIELPLIHFRIQYFNKIYAELTSLMNTPFSKKRFCLFISRNALNDNKLKIFRELSKLGTVDNISKYDVLLSNKSCYNSLELLKVFNHYKFIICFENSCTPGYITEKIFNVFLAKSIPIYDGAPDIDAYIHSKAYIKYNGSVLKNVAKYMTNESAYIKMVAENKIRSDIECDISLFANTVRDRLITNNTTPPLSDNHAVSPHP